VTYGNGLFISVGNGIFSERSTILTSPDGVSWGVRRSTTTNGPWLNGIAYGNGIFVAVGGGDYYGGLGVIFTSTDGVSWMRVSLNEPTWYLSKVIYANNAFVAVGYNNFILTSSDALVWTAGTIDSTTWIEWIFDVTYGNGTFVAVGSQGTLLTSSDALKWTEKHSVTSNDLFGITYGNGAFIVVGDGGSILQSDQMGSTCTAVLSPSLDLHVPIINFKGTYILTDFQYEQGPTPDLLFKVRDAAIVTDLSDYSICQASTLLLENNYKLHIPTISLNNMYYWADFEYVPSTDGQIWFKLVKAGAI
jgi:hypothetical protein